jgi:hypothetical protein
MSSFLTKNIIISILWAEGILTVAYGMLWHNDFTFVTGIVSITIGYLLIRKKLKRSNEKQKENN